VVADKRELRGVRQFQVRSGILYGALGSRRVSVLSKAFAKIGLLLVNAIALKP
jgi:hypothetical protein